MLAQITPKCEQDFRQEVFAKNPFTTFAWLREHHPIYRMPDGFFVLSRYDDVKFALKRYDLFASGWGDAAIAHPGWLHEDCKRDSFLTETDPPEHSQYAALVNRSFVTGAINTLAPLLKKKAESLLEEMRSRDGAFDFLSLFAYPFTAAALSSITGLAIDQQLSRIRRWINVSESFTSQCPEPSQKIEMEHVIQDQNNYYDQLIEDRRLNPRKDLVSILANASIAGRPLTTGELRTALGLFTTAGFHAPAQFLASAIAYLLQRPGLLTLLKTQENTGPFVEEFLRLSNPAQGVFRTTTQSIAMHGVTIPEKSKILVLIGSANRDPAQFPDPDEFQLSRTNIRTHLGFGYGVHTCLGAALARLEMKIAIDNLLPILPHLHCPSESELDWYSTVVGRLLNSLPLTLRLS